MPEIVEKCLLCNAERSQLFDQRTFEGRLVENRICKACGFVFQSPRMTAAETNDFYAVEYRKLYQGSSTPIEKDLAVQEQRAESLAAFTRKHVKQVARVLDVGCSAGLLMQAFNHTFGCTPVGIEPGDAYREVAAKTGFKTYASLKEMQSAGEKRFDLISMAHVLEHIPDPLAYLTGLREQILSPEGCLLLEVPNLYMHDSFEVAHLSSFSAHSLRRMVAKAGFNVIVMKKHGRPRSKFLPYYLTVLCCPVTRKIKASQRPERAVRFKRRMGLTYRRIMSRLFPAQAWKSFVE
jgi:2-polyprenyl-3-methyl-5-hydroxy-6-metoxy-1,4-benzoquinol methylase